MIKEGPASRMIPFRVLITSGTFEPGFRGGGPVRSLVNIIDTASNDVEIVLVTSDRDLGAAEPYPGLSGRWVARGRARIFYLDMHSVTQWIALLRVIRKVPFDLLYLNSLWAPKATVIPVILAALRVIRSSAILIAPRGELASGALSIKARKKRAVMKPWEVLLRGMGVRWHATADHEATDIRMAFPWAQVHTSKENPANLPLDPIPPQARNDCRARLVFISRIVPVKNLDVILTALRSVHEPLEFDIYGPIEDTAYWAACLKLIEELPANVRTIYRGELAPEDVRRAFSQYDAFIFPTRSENFGHVIAESLSASCPVVCSAGTSWNDVLRHGGGTVLLDLDTDLRRRISRIAAMTPEQRLAARHQAAKAYCDWRKGIARMDVLDEFRVAMSGAGR